MVAASTVGTDVVIPANGKIDLDFGGLAITNASVTPQCAATATDPTDAAFVDCTAVTAAIAEDKKKLTLTVTPGGANATDNIAMSGLRLDVSGLAVDAEVMAKISSAGTTGVDFGSGAGLSASRHAATVKAGITFSISHASRLYCSTPGRECRRSRSARASPAPGESNAIGTSSTHVKLKILNVPSGVTFIWPGQKHDDAMPNPTVTKDLRAADPNRAETDKLDSLVATLEFVPAGLSTDTTEAVYKFVPMDYATTDNINPDTDAAAINPAADEMHQNRADTFKLELVVAIDAAKAGAGGTADIWGWLHPAPGSRTSTPSCPTRWWPKPRTPMTTRSSMRKTATS